MIIVKRKKKQITKQYIQYGHFSMDNLTISRIHHLIVNNVLLKLSHSLCQPSAIACVGIPFPCKEHLSHMFLGVPKCVSLYLESNVGCLGADAWGLCWAEAPALTPLSVPEVGLCYHLGCCQSPTHGVREVPHLVTQPGVPIGGLLGPQVWCAQHGNSSLRGSGQVSSTISPCEVPGMTVPSPSLALVWNALPLPSSSSCDSYLSGTTSILLW